MTAPLRRSRAPAAGHSLSQRLRDPRALTPRRRHSENTAKMPPRGSTAENRHFRPPTRRSLEKPGSDCPKLCELATPNQT